MTVFFFFLMHRYPHRIYNHVCVGGVASWKRECFQNSVNRFCKQSYKKQNLPAVLNAAQALVVILMA